MADSERRRLLLFCATGHAQTQMVEAPDLILPDGVTTIQVYECSSCGARLFLSHPVFDQTLRTRPPH